MDSTKSDEESEVFFDCESFDSPQLGRSSNKKECSEAKMNTECAENDEPVQSEQLHASNSNDDAADVEEKYADAKEKDADVKEKDADVEEKDANEGNELPESLLDNLNELKVEKKEEEEEEELSEEEKEKLRIEAVEFKVKGNEEYKERKFTEAYALYSEGLRICPKACTKERSILLGNRCACLMALYKKDMAIADCNEAIKLNPGYVKVLLRRAQLLEDTDKLEEALADYKKLLEIDPTIPVARAACMRLPKKIEERNEKMKKEMLGQLKNLGNKLLSPFGLSTNNFKMEQNEGGSYNIQFVQNQQQHSGDS